jgi:hypothetical protein
MIFTHRSEAPRIGRRVPCGKEAKNVKINFSGIHGCE